jgi:hypothetical protein
VLSTIENFPEAYEALFKKKSEEDVFLASFDIQAALKNATELQGRPSAVFTR